MHTDDKVLLFPFHTQLLLCVMFAVFMLLSFSLSLPTTGFTISWHILALLALSRIISWLLFLCKNIGFVFEQPQIILRRKECVEVIMKVHSRGWWR